MKPTGISLALVFGLALHLPVASQTPRDSADARQPVQSFYKALNSHDFEHGSDYSTADWETIRPTGGRLRGRDAVLAELKRTHATFLKDVTVTIDEMDLRFAAPTVAVVTVNGHASAFTSPDGVLHDNERRMRAFVVVKRNGQWLIMHDQSTTISVN
jgi:uncharacterized protein (TIGR02246 family)